jgi:hypothetical protein
MKSTLVLEESLPRTITIAGRQLLLFTTLLNTTTGLFFNRCTVSITILLCVAVSRVVF